MPFASKSQQRFMFAKHPEMAKEFASKMSDKDFSKLPEKVSKTRQEAFKRLSKEGDK